MAEHVKADGTPDMRFKENKEEAANEIATDRDTESSNKRSTSATENEESGGVYKPTEHDGLRKDGEPDKRVSPEHGFGGDHERAAEAGHKGGLAHGHHNE